MKPLSPKNLRITAILIAVYKVLTALVLMVVMVFGLAYPEEMNKKLEMSIVDMNYKPERRPYRCIHTQHTNEFGQKYDIWALTIDPPAPRTIVTPYMLQLGTTVVNIYMLLCLMLLLGILRNRHKLFIPWLVGDILSSLGILIAMVIVGCNDYINDDVDKPEFLGICSIVVLFHLTIWGVIRKYYIKLREQAMVPIPATDAGICPSGDGGPKLILLNANDANNVV